MEIQGSINLMEIQATTTSEIIWNSKEVTTSIKGNAKTSKDSGMSTRALQKDRLDNINNLEDSRR